MEFIGVIICVLFVLNGATSQDETLVNDTVIGDPLIMVPILASNNNILNELNATRLSLCYEIHGHDDEIYNLVTSKCVSINAHYDGFTDYLNAIDQIGVRAVDNDGFCKNIQVNVMNCLVSVNGVAVSTHFSSGGITVNKSSNNVHVSVPNCDELSLVMWISCETQTIEDPFGNGNEVTGDMLKFTVSRGLNFGHRLSHGLLGQFWNIPVTIEPFSGVDRDDNPVPDRYKVSVTSSLTGENRGYTGRLYELSWSFEDGPCLYVGNRQAGPIYKIRDPNDPVIEGDYGQYSVLNLFSEDGFKYSLFQEDSCLPEE